jgi:excisionase family DNA binding protein
MCGQGFVIDGRGAMTAEVHVGMIRFNDAARRLGVTRPTLRKKVEAFGMPTFRSAIDGRARLIREEDIERLLESIPERTPAPLRAAQ